MLFTLLTAVIIGLIAICAFAEDEGTAGDRILTALLAKGIVLAIPVFWLVDLVIMLMDMEYQTIFIPCLLVVSFLYVWVIDQLASFIWKCKLNWKKSKY